MPAEVVAVADPYIGTPRKAWRPQYDGSLCSLSAGDWNHQVLEAGCGQAVGLPAVR